MSLEAGARCHSCGVAVGGFHHLYCFFERCPLCGDQALFCEHSEAPEGSKARGANSSPFLGDYRLSDVMRLTGAKRSQIENWVRSGWLQPEGPSTGTGDHRRFSFRNLVDASLGVRLSLFHVPLRTFFRDTDMKTLRDLIPDFSSVNTMTDQELADHQTQGYTEADWAGASGVARDVLLTRIVERYRTDARKWRAFIDPDRRSRDTYSILELWIDEGKYRVQWSDGGDQRIADTSLVINLGNVFDELEQATGDRWGSDLE